MSTPFRAKILYGVLKSANDNYNTLADWHQLEKALDDMEVLMLAFNMTLVKEEQQGAPLLGVAADPVNVRVLRSGVQRKAQKCASLAGQHQHWITLHGCKRSPDAPSQARSVPWPRMNC